MEDETADKSKELVKVLKAAASANRDFLFGFVGVKQWQDFAESFEVNKKTVLPKMIVWDGNEEYFSVSFVLPLIIRKISYQFLEKENDFVFEVFIELS